MTEHQGWHLIGIGWLAIAIIDEPVDAGTLFYAGVSIVSFIVAVCTAGKP